jgi:uncharacterized protein
MDAGVKNRIANCRLPTLSAEVFVIPLEDHFLIYAPLRRAAFVANATVVNILANLKIGRSDATENHDPALFEFLRRLEIIDASPEELPLTGPVGDPFPTSVSLFLTTACNLRCHYCYAAAGDTPQQFMNLEVAKRGIDYVAQNAVTKGVSFFEIAYHGGGEPAVNWKTMTESLEYAQRKAEVLGLDVFAGVATNGVLNATQIDWMMANLKGASVSFDGIPAVHDQHRIMVNGSGSSERVMHTLRRFDAAGFDYALRMTVTQEQISALPDSVEFICQHFKPAHIQVEPAYQLGRWAQAPSSETADFIAAYREAHMRARLYGQEIMYSAARLNALTNHFCGVTQDSFCLSPQGNVSACYESFSESSQWAEVFFYGKPDGESNGYVWDQTVLQNLRQQAVQHRPYCQGCFAKWHCAGDCYHKALSVDGNKAFAGSDRCHITRELTKDQILSRIVAAGGLFWHAERDPQPCYHNPNRD